MPFRGNMEPDGRDNAGRAGVANAREELPDVGRGPSPLYVATERLSKLGRTHVDKRWSGLPDGLALHHGRANIVADCSQDAETEYRQKARDYVKPSVLGALFPALPFGDGLFAFGFFPGRVRLRHGH